MPSMMGRMPQGAVLLANIFENTYSIYSSLSSSSCGCGSFLDAKEKRMRMRFRMRERVRLTTFLPIRLFVIGSCDVSKR